MLKVFLKEKYSKPGNVFLGKKIGQGYWGNVHRALIKSAAIRKLQSIISVSLKHQHVFSAVKILKGILILYLPSHVNQIFHTV